MKTFKYRFEEILKAKKNAEDSIRNECKKIQNEINLEEIKLNLAEEKERQMAAEMIRKNFSGGVEEIKMYHQYIIYLREFVKRKRENIAELNQKLEKKRKDLLEAVKETKTFSKIKEKDEKEYLAGIELEERKMNDEAALFRYRHGMIGLVLQ